MERIKKVKRELIYLKYGGKCAYCGSNISPGEMQIDHIIPKSSFRTMVANKYKVPSFLEYLTEDDVEHIDNLNPACRVCNKWKSSHDLELFRSEIYEQIKRLNSYSANYRMARRYGLVKEVLHEVEFYFESKYWESYFTPPQRTDWT